MSIRLSAAEIKPLKTKLQQLENILSNYGKSLQPYRAKFAYLDMVLREIARLQLMVNRAKTLVEHYEKQTLV
mgnify:CR=1 FL=1